MHSNGEIIKQTYDAFGRGDMPTVFGILDKEIKWHVPGQSPLSGDYRGHDEVMGFFKKCMDLSQGTLRIDLRDIAATETSVFVLCTVSADRAGQHAEFLEVHLWRMVNGHPVKFREFQGDEYTENKNSGPNRLNWCPLYPRKQTFVVHSPMSVLGHMRTSGKCHCPF